MNYIFFRATKYLLNQPLDEPTIQI